MCQKWILITPRSLIFPLYINIQAIDGKYLIEKRKANHHNTQLNKHHPISVTLPHETTMIDHHKNRQQWKKETLDHQRGALHTTNVRFFYHRCGAFTSQIEMPGVSVDLNIYALNSLDMASKRIIKHADLSCLVQDQRKTPCSNNVISR